MTTRSSPHSSLKVYSVAGEVAASNARYRVLTDRHAVPVRVSSPWSLPCFR